MIYCVINGYCSTLGNKNGGCNVNNNELRTCARSFYSRVTPSAPVRAQFAALQRHPAPVHGENAEMKQQSE